PPPASSATRRSSSATTPTSPHESCGCTTCSWCRRGVIAALAARSSPPSRARPCVVVSRAWSGACGIPIARDPLLSSTRRPGRPRSHRVAARPCAHGARGTRVIRLLVNATVLTMDASLPQAEALAVRDGRIVEVGGTDEVLWLREGEYEVIDLEGRTVTPGFVDPPSHLSIGAFETLWADCRGARSGADVQGQLSRAARETPAGAWVRGVGYDHQLIGAHPTRGDLDAAVPDRP